MKRVALSLWLMCFPTFAQDDLLGRDQEIREQVRHLEHFAQIRRAISAHQSFQLPGTPQSSTVRMTAIDVTNSVNTLRFTDVEILTDILTVHVDALNYYWDTGELRSYGKVSVEAISSR